MRARDIITKQLVILAGYEPSNEDTIASWHLFERDTDAIIAALRAAGYELVPVEATRRMLHDAANVLTNSQPHQGIPELAVFPAFEMWAAFLSAAKEQT